MQLDIEARQRVMDLLVVAENRILLKGVSAYYSFMEQARNLAENARAYGVGAYNDIDAYGTWDSAVDGASAKDLR